MTSYRGEDMIGDAGLPLNKKESDRLVLLECMSIVDRRKFLQNRVLEDLRQLQTVWKRKYSVVFPVLDIKLEYLLILIRPEVNCDLNLTTKEKVEEYIWVTCNFVASQAYLANTCDTDLHRDTNVLVTRAFDFYEDLRDMTPEFCASFMSAKDISVASLVTFLRNDASHKYDSVIMEVSGGS